MSSESHESLSAAMDGEISSFELRRLIERTHHEEAIPQKWSRYHLAQQIMHLPGSLKCQSVASSSSLIDRVHGALENEPVHSKHVEDAQQSDSDDHNVWWKPLASMAIAASVTAMVILGGQQFVQEEGVDPSLRQAYTIPGVQTSNDFVRAQYGNFTTPRAVSSAGSPPDVIRLSQGLDRYIDQHRHLLSSTPPSWKTDWLPEGFVAVRHEVMPHAEVMVYSDGRHSVSVSVEPLGRQSVSAGVTQSDNVVAVGMAKSQSFVTVVGDVPLMIADRIAASVKEIR